MSWRVKKLGSIAKFLSGGTPSKQKPEYWGGNIPWVSAKDLLTSRISDSQLHVTEEGLANGTKLVPENTILFVVRGMSLAKEFRISLSKVPVAFNQDLKALQLKEDTDPRFLFYSLYAQREHIRQLAGEASHGTKKLPTEVIEAIEVSIPDDVLIQKKLGEAAAHYDDLIENNRRRIQLLEQSARLLYKEWFVHLRFPGHEHVEVIDGVPQGWEKRPLSYFCSDIRQSVSPQEMPSETPYIGLEHIPRRSITLSDWGFAKDIESKKFLFEESDIIFGKIRAYFHKVGLAFTSGITSADAIVIRPHSREIHSYCLMLASSDEFVALASTTAKEGSKMPRADWKYLLTYEFLEPSKTVIQLFNEQIIPITHQLKALAFQNKGLQQARDLLLPRLMNGEITL
ncbi:restriction modification system dna specificity domain-containing protein [Leptolyngbya sp. Heron Island J]|uniref:restriction endonuclease subunit S n=1 Tax=Leptolyngbya sp. Heron Island J TaxID=1385935 RepID=UPI0003B95BCC|nr:restriction endonuclease subunit S [Leptolyngbya sp. Heron Island J]ESA35112.1 restriction modification system dna specificity domain-containing protein [Leptolyngbya sp. Heron Island J]